MLELILLWMYIGAFNAVIGLGALKILYRVLTPGCKVRPFSLPSLELAGIVVITVYAETVSLFAPVSMAAHLLLLAVCLAILVIYRKDIGAMIHRLLPHNRSEFWERMLLCSLVLFTAFFACQGTQHTDTGIYHAQAIRWYEEYGAVKGLGNLQQHQAYNSSSLAYAAFFSVKWLVGQSLHGTNGFIQAFLVAWAVKGLGGAWKRQRHLADGCRIAILLYALVVSERIMSPATDFPSMYIVMWIVNLWVSNMENNGWPEQAEPNDLGSRPNSGSQDKIYTYGALSLAVVYVATCKLSAGLMVVAALYPGIWLLRRKKWKEIVVFLSIGILILLPWLARNYIVSGWLLYPFTSIDLFNVDWKVPAEYAQHDSDQIKVYGRCLYDVARVNDPISTWLPIWWSEKNRPEMMLIIGNVLAAAGLFLGGLVHMMRCLLSCRTHMADGDKAQNSSHPDACSTNDYIDSYDPYESDCCADKSRDDFSSTRRSISLDKITLYLAILICIAGWFVTAPFIRYGLAFLLLLPCMVVGDWLRSMPMNVWRIASGYGCVAVFLCMSMYWDYYVLFDITWIKQHLSCEHLVTQQDYDRPEVTEYEMEGGLTIYIPPSGSDNLSYYAFPGSAYLSMAERTKLRGTTIRDGFMAKEQ